MREFIIFSDGACSGNPGPGGWASIVAEVDQHVEELGGSSPATTNNRMEIEASLSALEWVRERVGDDKINIRLYSDSKYVVEGGSQWIFGWQKKGWKTSQGDEVKNLDLWQRLWSVLQELRRNGRIHWEYVAAHSGIEANERCDQVAVAFSQGESPFLYSGDFSEYSISLSVPEKKPSESKSKDKSVASKPYYLSLIHGKVYRDETWPQCQGRVQGAPGARYKKVKSSSEEELILKQWGFSGKSS